MSQTDIVVAFRTHAWDADVAALAAKLRHASPGAEVVILAYESRGCLESAEGKPFSWRFSKPLIARYVRITLIGENYLHLDEIEIFGEPA